MTKANLKLMLNYVFKLLESTKKSTISFTWAIKNH